MSLENPSLRWRGFFVGVPSNFLDECAPEFGQLYRSDSGNGCKIFERAWGDTEGTWVGAPAGAVVVRGPFNPCPGSAFATYLAPCLVRAHCHLLNTNSDTDSGLDDPSSFHPGGANALFADGSVHFLRSVLGDLGVYPNGSTIYTPSSLIQQALGTRAGSEVISSDSY